MSNVPQVDSKTKDIAKTLIRLADENRLHHAYLLFGPKSAQKKELALSLARHLEQSKPFIDTRIWEEEKIGIDEIRDIKKFLFQTPLRSKKRTCIIEEAEHITWQAAPALLKIVEEPPPHSLIIITAREKEVLSKTLLSRLIKIYIPPQKNIRDISVHSPIRDYSLAEEIEQSMIDLYNKDKIKNAKKISFLLHKLEASRLNLNPKLQKKAIEYIIHS